LESGNGQISHNSFRTTTFHHLIGMNNQPTFDPTPHIVAGIKNHGLAGGQYRPTFWEIPDTPIVLHFSNEGKRVGVAVTFQTQFPDYPDSLTDMVDGVKNITVDPTLQVDIIADRIRVKIYEPALAFIPAHMENVRVELERRARVAAELEVLAAAGITPHTNYTQKDAAAIQRVRVDTIIGDRNQLTPGPQSHLAGGQIHSARISSFDSDTQRSKLEMELRYVTVEQAAAIARYLQTGKFE
jgi:hypothetical protein